MQVKFSNKGTTLIISVIGELDHHSADYVREKIEGEMIKASTKNIVFDFSKISFMDSSGIGIIMGRYKSMQTMGGKVALAGLNPQIKRIFEVSGLFKLVSEFDSIDSAVNMM